MAKYYINQYIKNIAKKNNNVPEKELDDVEKELDKIANKLLEEGTTPFDQNPYGMFVSVRSINNPPQGLQLTIIKQDDNPQNAILIETETPDTYNVLLVNEEHSNYFSNKFIKYSAKDFIISSLINYIYSHGSIMNTIDNTNTYRSIEQVISGIENNLALNDFKFGTQYYVSNDIDISEFISKGAMLVFDENETKKIFYMNTETDTFYIEGVNDIVSMYDTYADTNRYKIIDLTQIAYG